MMATQPKQFTGRHMLAIMIAFFGVIIAVNLTMAYFARSSWTGFVVQNSYVASQQFNKRMAETRAQAQLGWTGALTVDRGQPRYRILDRNGNGVTLKTVSLTFMRPVDDREDQTLALNRDGDGSFVSGQVVADGVWIVHVEADAGLQTPYRETLRIRLAGGARS